MPAIYKRELRSYFCSMTGYIFMAAVIVFTGIYFMANNLSYGIPYFSYTIVNSLLIYVVVVPILTMRSLAEERHSKTDQLLLTSPASVTSIVMGKYLAMMTVFVIPLILFCICPLIISTGGSSYILGDYISIFSMFVIGLLFVAIGMFVSSLTENQIISAVITLLILLALYIWDSLVMYLPITSSGSLICLFVVLAAVVLCVWLFSKNYIITIVLAAAGVIALLAWYILAPDMFQNLMPSLLSHFSINAVLYNFCYYYVFDLGGLFMCLSLAAVFVFFTIQTIQKRRWN